MQHDISTIKNFKIIDGAFSEKGFRLIAAFNVSVNGIYIIGCTLSERDDGTVRMAGPRGTTHVGHKIMTHFEDPDIDDSITDRAVAIYSGITGRSLTVVYRTRPGTGAGPELP